MGLPDGILTFKGKFSTGSEVPENPDIGDVYISENKIYVCSESDYSNLSTSEKNDPNKVYFRTDDCKKSVSPSVTATTLKYIPTDYTTCAAPYTLNETNPDPKIFKRFKCENCCADLDLKSLKNTDKYFECSYCGTKYWNSNYYKMKTMGYS